MVFIQYRSDHEINHQHSSGKKSLSILVDYRRDENIFGRLMYRATNLTKRSSHVFVVHLTPTHFGGSFTSFLNGRMYLGRVIWPCRNRCHVDVRFLCAITEDNVRVRFAPSPTGYIHLGGLRTALYNHLFAKSKNGTSILRIEDTDQTRIVEGATEKIIEDLKWCGIHYDEGPYFQSERKKLYQEHAKLLIEYGEAYYCFCSEKRLDLLRKELLKSGQIVRYDNKCKELSKEEVNARLRNNESHCIRLKLTDEIVGFKDLIYGDFHNNLTEREGDPIILKSDGFPTYHLANVVDDHLMNISHVLRGSEWLISTVKHLLMFKAFRWKPPLYGHLPLLLNSDGSKFSKRQNDLRISYFRENGIFGNTLVNLVTRAGGGFEVDYWERDDRNFSLEELIEKFSLSKVNRNSCKLSMEHLDASNRLEIKRLLKNEIDRKVLIEMIKNCVKDYFSKMNPGLKLLIDDEYVLKVLNIASDRIYKIEDLISKEFSFMWASPEYKFADEGSITREILKTLISEMQNTDWNRKALNAFFREFSKNHNIVYRELMGNLRLILTSLKDGPSVAEILALLGRDNSIMRIENAIKD